MLKVCHGRIGPTYKAYLIELVLADEVQRGHGIAVARSEVQEPMGAFGDLPAATHFDDRQVIGIKGDVVLAGHAARWRRARIREPIHHWLHVAATRAPDEAHRRELVMFDDLDYPICLGFASTGIDHPMTALNDLPAPAKLGN